MTMPGPAGGGDAPHARAVRSPADSTQAPAEIAPSRLDQEFACFYRQYIGRLILYLICQGAPAHLAAELAQEAMIMVYQRWATIKSPRAYAYTIAYRAFIRHTLHTDEFPVAEIPEPTIVMPHPGNAEAWLQEQEIIEVLRALPPRQRQVLALAIDGWTHAEIAGLLGIELPAVRANLMKARRGADAHRRRIKGEEL